MSKTDEMKNNDVAM